MCREQGFDEILIKVCLIYPEIELSPGLELFRARDACSCTIQRRSGVDSPTFPASLTPLESPRAFSPPRRAPQTPVFFKLSRTPDFVTLSTTFRLLLTTANGFASLTSALPPLTSFPGFSSPFELPHRVTLTVLPLSEEGSRRVSPSNNFGSDSLRPP
ncbi:hypothetical protein VTN49DRAFT_3887 [Thermomyces lanuginosus]|uniref:uncharacterized protein n=1 Tax=Thermomyces lanuginosus TaxID=5541 RepID=UPI003744611F